MSDQRDGILVPEHFVPTPTTISPEAQAFLRLKLPLGLHVMPPVGDVAAWKAFTASTDARISEMTRVYAARHPGSSITHHLSASKIYEVTPDNLSAENEGRALYYIHGGGFTGGAGESAINLAMQMAGLSRCKTYSIDYRLAPEFPFPVPLDDTLEGYRFILQRHRADQVGVFGPSAGANLAVAMILKARDLGIEMPAACAAHSCPSDMSTFGDSGYANDTVDIVIPHVMPELNLNYAGDHDQKDPYMSPVYGDFSKGFPPTILSSGTRDLLLSGTVRQHRAMVRAGIAADLHVWEAMTHSPFRDAPEEEELYMQHISFMLKHMAKA